MSTVELVRKPLKIAGRIRRIRESWNPQERIRRAQESSLRLNALIARLSSKMPGNEIWAIGSLTPADLRRLPAYGIASSAELAF